MSRRPRRGRTPVKPSVIAAELRNMPKCARQHLPKESQTPGRPRRVLQAMPQPVGEMTRRRFGGMPGGGRLAKFAANEPAR